MTWKNTTLLKAILTASWMGFSAPSLFGATDFHESTVEHEDGPSANDEDFDANSRIFARAVWLGCTSGRYECRNRAIASGYSNFQVDFSYRCPVNRRYACWGF